MGAFDAVMWGVEDDPMLRSVITVVMLLDTEPNLVAGVARVDRMTRVAPKLRQRVVGNPLSLIPPRWETDPNFDLNYHLRLQRLPRRGNLREVLELAEQISEQDFDRSRPLWELTLVTGLARRQSAVIFKLHHAITDGIGGMQMAATLFDLTREPEGDLGPLPAELVAEVPDLEQRVEQAVLFEAKSTTEQLTGAMSASAGFAKRALTDPLSTVIASQQFGASAIRMLAPTGKPLSDVMTERSLSVSFSLIEVSLTGLKAAAKAVNGSLNDAFMAAVTGGLRCYHLKHNSDIETLRVNMPISLRAKDDEAGSAGGNRWIPARFEIPIALRSANARMRQLHPILTQARNEPALGLSDVVYRTLTALPRPITTGLAGSMMKGVDVAATNVPGPPIPLYVAGAKLLALVPFAPKAGAGVNVALLTYAGTCYVGVNSDRAAVEDADVLAECIAEAFAEVLAVGEPPPQ